jgi:N-alpha-acetyltransferase 38, NatC auxiliary subunit
MEKSQAEDYLTSLLNKTLRVTTTDTRMFLGQFKCTDSVPFPSSFPSSLVPPPCFPFSPSSKTLPHPSIPLPHLLKPMGLLTPQSKQDRNIILSQTFEYRLPPPPKPTSTSTTLPSTSLSSPENETTTLDLSSRYMGLVVVPGEYISRIEVEEFESQVRGKNIGHVGKGA